MSEVAARLKAVRARLDALACDAGRDPAEVKLLAVSKTFPAARVIEAAEAGQHAFGENRVQEADAKLQELRGRAVPGLEWHLIGRLQRNKARRAVELFDVIHSVDRPELVTALAKAAAALGRRPRVLVQVDIDGEPQKGGVAPADLGALVDSIEATPELELKGLMAIPRACTNPEEVRPSFRRLRELRDELKAAGRRLDELSMGMSADYAVAIQEGATWVRIGTAIFGPRRANEESAP